MNAQHPPRGHAGAASGTGPGPAATARRLCRGLFDDASLFPPGDLPMPAAIAAHLRHRSAWYADLTGPFVCPAAKLGDLGSVLTASNITAIDVSLIVPAGAAGLAAAFDQVAADPRLRLRAVEVPVSAGQDPRSGITELAATLDSVPLAAAAGYIELPLAVIADHDGGAELPALIDRRGYRPKLRTGGVTAAAFPAEPTLAAALTATAGRGIAFKCTAGLHHAVRQTAADTGLEQHGFLNVLLATSAAAAGADLSEVAGILAERDAAVITGWVRALDQDAVAQIRSLFTSFGTCSTDEPVADLTSLGLISRG